MKTFKIENGDLVLDGAGNIVMVEGREEEAQSIERLMTTNVGEWFLNPAHGFDYGVLQEKNVTEQQIRLAVMTALAQELRVDRVEQIEIERDQRRRTVKIKIVCRMKSGNMAEVVRDIG
jgi:phage baseplate assembly protein W